MDAPLIEDIVQRPAVAAPHEPTRLAVIIGRVRDGRFGPTVAAWFTGRAALRDDLTIDVIDVLDHRDGHGFAARIGAADAIVIVTPEYNHGYPGPLKTAIDSAVRSGTPRRSPLSLTGECRAWWSFALREARAAWPYGT